MNKKVVKPTPIKPFKFCPEFAGELVKKEVHNKPLYRPNTYLHKWWARRCGSTFRLLLKALVDDAANSDYYAAGGLEGKIILDPMMGGGTTLHEAIRMGANVIGVDVDPVPVLQARATLTTLPIEDVQPHWDSFFNRLRADLAPWWTTTCPDCQQESEIRHTLYGVRQSCDCQEYIKVDSFVVKRQQGGQLNLCAQCGHVHTDHASCHSSPLPFSMPLVDRSVKTCPDCGGTLKRKERPFHTQYEPVVIVGDCPTHGRFYRRPSVNDIALIGRANGRRASLVRALDGDGQRFAVTGGNNGHKSRELLTHGVGSYLDTLSSRQLLFLDSAYRHLQGMPDRVRLVLAMLVSTSLDFNSLLCGYKGNTAAGAVRHVFSRHGYTFPYTALENNPILNAGLASGTLSALYLKRVVRAKKWAADPTELTVAGIDGADKGKARSVAPRVTIAGEQDYGDEVRDYNALLSGQRRFMLLQQSSARLPLPDSSVDHIVTDPPYFDSVQYSDLARFFHGFLSLLAPDGAARWDDTSREQTAVSKDWMEFADVMGSIFNECGRVLKRPDGRLVFTFHHWQAEAWAALTFALKGAGFHLVDYYVVQSESPMSCHVNGLKSLLHDVVLVLSPNGRGRRRHPPLQIKNTDSAAFCDGCGKALGWLLQSKSEPISGEILKMWQHLL